MKEKEAFDESLRVDIAEFRRQIEEIWPKLEESGLAGDPYFQQALRKYPHLKYLYSEGRPIVRSVANLSSEENYPPNSGINITFYWQNGRKIELDTLRTEIELYPSCVGLIYEWDLGGDVDKKGHARREFLPMRDIQKGDLPRVQAMIVYLQNICNAV